MDKIKVDIKLKPPVVIKEGNYIFNISLGSISNLAGTKIGCINSCGYRQYWDKKAILLHRKIYEIGSGNLIPSKIEVCHKNGDKLDNRYSNLHLGSHQQNMQERGPQKSNTTGHKNITRHQNGWRVGLWLNGIANRKYFSKLQDAINYRDSLITTLNQQGHRYITNYQSI